MTFLATVDNRRIAEACSPPKNLAWESRATYADDAPQARDAWCQASGGNAVAASRLGIVPSLEVRGQ